MSSVSPSGAISPGAAKTTKPHDSMGLGALVSFLLTIPSGWLSLNLGFESNSLAVLFGLPLLVYSAVGIPLLLTGYRRTATGLAIGSAAFYILFVVGAFFLALLFSIAAAGGQ